MHNIVFVALLAVAVYFMLMKSTFEIQSGIFMYQEPNKVYEAISSMENIERFQPFVVSTQRVKKETSPQGIVTEYHTVEEHVPAMMNWTIPVIFDVQMEFTKPGEVLLFSYSVWYGMVVGRVQWTVEPRAGHEGPGSYLSYNANISSPWVTSKFTQQRAKEAQDEILQRIRDSIEYMSKLD